MLSGSQPSSTNTLPEGQANSPIDFLWLHEQSQVKEIPFDLTMTALNGNLEPINKTDKISPENKQWLYIIAFKNGHTEAGKNLTLDNKLDFLWEAVNTNNVYICRNILACMDKKELVGQECELEPIFNSAMMDHYFNIAHGLLEKFYPDLINNDTIYENFSWSSSSPEHYEALQWLLTKAPISIESRWKGGAVYTLIEKNAVEMLKFVLQQVNPEDKTDEDFLEHIEDAAQHALSTNKLDMLKLLLPYTNRKIIKDLLKEAAEKRFLSAMSFLLARAEEITKKGEDKKPISHEKQADYLRQLLAGIQEDLQAELLPIKTQAQAQGNEAVISVLEKHTYPLNSSSNLLAPPLVFSQAEAQSSAKRKKIDENLPDDKKEKNDSALPEERQLTKENYLLTKKPF